MEPPQHAFLGKGDIILNKITFDPRLAVPLSLKGFLKKTAGITKDLGLDQFNIWDFGFNYFHRYAFTTSRIGGGKSENALVNDIDQVLAIAIFL